MRALSSDFSITMIERDLKNISLCDMLICLKFGVDSRYGTKKSEKDFNFKDNCLSFPDNKFSQSRKGCFSLADNVLRNTPNI